jgi:hypothetical protein
MLVWLKSASNSNTVAKSDPKNNIACDKFPVIVLLFACHLPVKNIAFPKLNEPLQTPPFTSWCKETNTNMSMPYN